MVQSSTSTSTSNKKKELQAAESTGSMEDRKHVDPSDRHKLHCWLFEPPIAKGVLTVDGMTQIAEHKYKGGSYTFLDTVFSPNLWEPITQLFPMWLAPNLVTTLGGGCCLWTFLCSTYYLSQVSLDGSSSTYQEDPFGGMPSWIYLSNGICMFLYYTLDCCDGKQARRTNTSSPLGQLFDHGMDCVCNLSHLQLVQCIVLLPNAQLLLMLQISLQFAFWQAQWEEYYTGTLPHATGNMGVTEVNYGMATWSIVTYFVGSRTVYDTDVSSMFPTSWQDASWHAWLTQTNTPNVHLPLQIRHVAAIGWFFMILALLVLSWMRVYEHVQGNLTLFSSAMSKFASPVLLSVVAVWGLNNPSASTTDNAAQTPGSLSLGLCFCLITIKIIVYSMAKMAYASIQVDILPWMMTIAALKLNLLPVSSRVVFQLLDMYYLIRLFYWVSEAIAQLCERLQIQLFRIPVAVTEEENKKKA